LLVFLHRHPRALLTTKQLAAFVGYDMQRVGKSLDAFMDAGLLERIQNPMHAARLFVLVLTEGDGLEPLLELASTGQGRRDFLNALKAARSNAGPAAQQNEGTARFPHPRRQEDHYA
jgi:DNA-binding MarR family transcriptional regulator